MVTIGKGGGISFKLVPPIVGLVGLVVTTNYAPWCSSPKVVDIAPIVFVLVPFNIYKGRWNIFEIWKGGMISL